MSRETLQHLNQFTLIGFVNARREASEGKAWYRPDGMAWHYNASKQGAENNHYDDAIPVADVERRLFFWDAIEAPISATAILPDGVLTVTDPTRKAILRPAGVFGEQDHGGILGIFRDSYCMHQYREWLLENVSHMLDSDIGIGSAGLLRQGAQAWVSVELPETMTTPSGFEYRPNLLAVTSLDGSLATTYQRVATAVCCDNSMSAALGEDSTKVKVKHSKYSNLKLIEARQALEIVHQIGDDFVEQVERLANTTVSDGDWSAFLDSLIPLADDKGNEKDGRGRTIALNMRDRMDSLYHTDPRCAPWKGTAFGVLQTRNTYEHWDTRVKGGSDARAERNMSRTITGKVDTLDRDTLDRLNKILVCS